MESLSRPFHRRKLSNANSFSGKNAYDGVFSGHRPKFDGVPAVNVDEYREIFSSGQAASSIPVLDLSTLQESSDGSNLELGSTKPDYGKIFGGFRDEDIAVSYEELVARDKARVSMSTSQSSQDLGDDDISHKSFDALKQYNMSYHKISQRGKDGIDGTTHVTQLHVVPGFTCFIDESASQPKKETKKQKSSIADKVHSPDKQTSQTGVESKSKHHQDESLSDDKKTDLKSHDSKLSSSPSTSAIKNEADSESKKETEKQKSCVANDVFLDKLTSQTGVESKSKYHQDELFSDDKKTDAKVESHNSKVSSPPASSTIKNEADVESKKETEKQKNSVTNDVFLDKQTSETGVESKSKYHQDELLSDDKKTDVKVKSHDTKVSLPPATSAIKNEEASESKKETEKQKSSVTEDDFLEKQTSKTGVESLPNDGISKKFEADINLHSFKGSSSPHVTSTTNVDNHKDYQKRSTATSDTNGAFSSSCFDDELDVNSVAFASTAALRKAIEKAQESIRIAMESVGRKKEGLKSYSNKSFKDSLKVKARVVNVSTIEKQKEKDDRIKEMFKARVANVNTSQVYSEFKDGEKLFGAKKVINEINEKIIESSENLEIPIKSSHELKDNKIVSDSKEVSETKRSFEEVENDTNESLHKDNKKPNGFFVLESCENEIRDTKDTIEDEKPIELKEDKDEVGQSEETSNLTLYQKVEEEKKLSHDFDQNGCEKSFDESLGLLENTKQEILEQEHDDDVASHELDSDDENEKEVKEESDNESFKEEEEDISEKFYDVCEVEIIENSSSDYDDAEDIEIINRIVIDTEEVDKSDNDVETNQEVDDVSDRSAQVIGEDDTDTDTDTDNDVESSQEVDDVSNNINQVTEEDKEAINTEEKVIFENISVDEIASKDNDELSHCGLADVDIVQKGTEQNDEKSESYSDTIHGMEIEVKEYKESEETLKKEENKNKIQECKEERPATIFEMETGTSQEHNNDSNEDMNDETIKVVEKEEQKRIKEVTNEERERERNRVAVERAIREVRERAFNEARERAAVERANAEVRQRVMEHAQEKAAMKASDVTSKIRAERAAVERATSEARQRALEKAMSQKKISEPKIQVNNIGQTPSSDLHISNGTSTESALRSKAKLEKHNRIMERAAKALAEKEKRDQLAQKEQAERSRLAENLDADIKRWSTGKEGNLRALLSTLQYILGPESGWQSVSLTEIITTSAVKKAYRKATLCVHPDKLQQRGASIQHKYICEKVFDLLKAAWNRFNSEER